MRFSLRSFFVFVTAVAAVLCVTWWLQEAGIAIAMLSLGIVFGCLARRGSSNCAGTVDRQSRWLQGLPPSTRRNGRQEGRAMLLGLIRSNTAGSPCPVGAR